MNFTSKNTHELEQGDIINVHGGRFLIDQEIKVSRSHPDHGGGACLYTLAFCLNPDSAELDPQVAQWVNRDGERWMIQGNRFATWAVEV